MKTIAALTLAACLAAGTASAEVVEQRPDGFQIRNIIVLDQATPDQAWAALGRVGDWWESAHSYSGDAANMTMPLQPGACFCEALPGGGVEHGRVLMAWPAQGTLRLNAPLGPLQAESLTAILTFQIEARAEGGVQIVQTMAVGGASPAAAGYAPAVDQVLSIQLTRLGRLIETGSAD